MQAHAHANDRPIGPLVLGQSFLCVDRSLHRIGSTAKGEEERVALCVDLGTVSSRDRLAHQLPMQLERIAILVAQPPKQICRPFDVREQERDRACRQLRHAGGALRAP